MVDLAIILERCREGDELAWEALVRRFQSRVYGIAYHYVGNREDARDVAQDIFVRIYRHLGSCPQAERFLPWIIRIARNASIDQIRRKNTRPPDTDIPAEDVVSLSTPGPDPEQRWVDGSREAIIHRALQDLTDLNREIILLKEIQGLPIAEIASLLKVPIGTVKSRSSRARIELAQRVRALSNNL